MSRRWLAAGAAAVVAAAAVAALGGWYLLRRDDVEPATVADAVAAFRAREASAAATGRSANPIPTGVYVYETDGVEQTDALGGGTHRYPTTSSITVIGDPCGVLIRWDVLDGRSTTWQLCLGPEGWTQQTRDERHTFFGIGDRTTYRCARTAFRPQGDKPDATFAVACRTEDATERGRGRVVGRESCSVGGSEVDCAHVRTRTTLAGETRGTASYDFWLARSTGLPVAIQLVSRTTNGSLIGDVHYEEEVSLRLTSLTPRR